MHYYLFFQKIFMKAIYVKEHKNSDNVEYYFSLETAEHINKE